MRIFKHPKTFLIISSCVLCATLFWQIFPWQFRKPIIAHGFIGTYLQAQGSNMQLGNPVIEIGNGFFLSGDHVFGWPKKSGVTQLNFDNRDVKVVIDLLFTEVKKISGFGNFALRWDSPEYNNVVHIGDNGETKYLTSTEDITRWSIAISENLNYLGWIEFSARESNDNIIFINRQTEETTKIERRNSIHRKPLCTNSHFYWMRESIEKGGARSVSIMRMSVDRKKEELVATSMFPNVITDYQVSRNDTIAIIRKNYDQQRSELSIIRKNGQKSLYFEEDSYIQNLVSIGDDDRFWFEIKRHRSLWRVALYDVNQGKIKDLHKETMSALMRGEHNGEPAINFHAIPMAYGDMYLELLTRYSPPISGFSLYDNGFAVLSITEASIIRSLINFSEVSGNLTYLYWAAERVKNILRRTDIALRRRVNRDQASPTWSVRVFSNNSPDPASFLVHDALIFDAVLMLAERMKSNRALDLRYPGMLAEIERLFLENYDFHRKNLVNYQSDKFGLTHKGEMYFVFPRGDGYKYDGINLPFNMMNAYVRPLLRYSELSGDSSYKDVAIAIGKLFKRHILKLDHNDSYLWPYWWGLYADGWKGKGISANTPFHKPSAQKDIEDVDHASLDLRAVIALVGQNSVFDTCDLRKFANTVVPLIEYDDYRSPLLIDGSIKSANYNSIEYLWGELAESDERVLARLKERIKDFPYIQDAYIATARFEIVGISHLVKATVKSQVKAPSVRINCN